MQVEFTDRYGGHPPSWLRACLGDCEAMGYIPVSLGTEDDPALIALWHKAEAREPAEDGWHFVRCPECGGTGRVSWRRTVLRIPRWLVRGLRFVWVMGIVRNKECRPPSWTWWREFVLAFKCAFVYGVIRLRRP